MRTFTLTITMDATDEDDFINAVLEMKRRELHECTVAVKEENPYDTMKCGCAFGDVAWDERVIGEACGCTSCVDCGLINTQDPHPRKWQCYPEHSRSCSQKEASE